MHLWTLMDLWIYLDGLEHLLLYMWYILWWMWYVRMDVGMDEIYMWWMRYMIVWIYLLWWNVKKLKITVLGHFAECCTRQRTPLPSAMATALGKAEKMGVRKTIFPALPSAMTMVLGKEFFQTLPSAGQRALGKDFFFKKIQTLPSAGQRALGKDFFLKKNQTLPSTARGHSGKNF